MQIAFSDDALGSGAVEMFLRPLINYVNANSYNAPVFDVTKTDGTVLEGMGLHSVSSDDLLFLSVVDSEELVLIPYGEIITLTYC